MLLSFGVLDVVQTPLKIYQKVSMIPCKLRKKIKNLEIKLCRRKKRYLGEQFFDGGQKKVE